METKELLTGLQKTYEKYNGINVGTFALRIDLLAKDCHEKITELQDKLEFAEHQIKTLEGYVNEYLGKTKDRQSKLDEIGKHCRSLKSMYQSQLSPQRSIADYILQIIGGK